MPLPSDYLGTENVVTNGKSIVHPIKIVKRTLTNPLAAVTNGVSVSHTGLNAAGTRLQTLGGSLTSGGVATFDFSRNVVITVTHASSIVAMSGVISGYDQYGTLITEAWAVTATGTSKTFTGKKAFLTVISISEVTAADASGNSIISGSGTVFGLGHYSLVASPLKEVAVGAVVTTGTMVAMSAATTDDARGTYSPATAPDGTKTYLVIYLTADLYHVK